MFWRTLNGVKSGFSYFKPEEPAIISSCELRTQTRCGCRVTWFCLYRTLNFPAFLELCTLGTDGLGKLCGNHRTLHTPRGKQTPENGEFAGAEGRFENSSSCKFRGQVFYFRARHFIIVLSCKRTSMWTRKRTGHSNDEHFI